MANSELFPKGHLLIILIVAVFILAMPAILSINNPWFTLNDQGLANIGTALSITAPFIGIGSSVLVYLAFRVQFKANQEINEKFEKQNDDQLFFKVIENLNEKVKNTSLTIDTKTHIGIQAIFTITKNLARENLKYSTDIGKEILNNNEDIINQDKFEDWAHSVGCPYDNSINLKEKLLNNEAFADDIYGDVSRSVDELLKKLGFEYRYSSDFEIRQKIYEKSFRIVSTNIKGIIEHYIVTTQYLLNFLIQKKNSFYTSYFIDNLTNVEKAFIFYYCSSLSGETKFKSMIKELGIINDIELYQPYLHDKRAESIPYIKEELKSILN